MPDLPQTHDLAGNPYQSPPSASYSEPEPLPQEKRELSSVPKKKFSKIWLVVVGLLMIGAVFGYFTLTSFELPFFQDNGPVTLTYWGVGIPELAMQPLIDEYHATHPNITINYSQQSLSQYQKTLQTRIKGGTGPDLFRFHNSWTTILKDQLAAVPPSTYDNAQMNSLFYPTLGADVYIGGKFYGIPLMYDGLVMAYNADLLQAAGFATPPQTWSDVRQVYAPKLTSYNPDGSIAVSGIALGTANNVDYFSDILGLLILQNGAHLTDGKQVLIDKSFDNSGANLGAQALDFYTLFARKEFQGKGADWDATLPSSSQSLATGRVAMILVPEAKLKDIVDLMNSSGHHFNLKIAPVPQSGGQAAAVNWANYWVEGVSGKSHHQRAAWDFLKYLSSKEVEEKLYMAEAKLKGIGEAPSQVDAAKDYASDVYAGPLLSQAPSAKSWFMTGGSLDQGVDEKVINALADAINSVLTQNIKPESAIAKAASTIAQTLSPYGVVQPSAAPAGN